VGMGFLVLRGLFDLNVGGDVVGLTHPWPLSRGETLVGTLGGKVLWKLLVERLGGDLMDRK